MDNQVKPPLVLVRVPAYNHEAYITNCLESIAADRYPNKLVVVTDDCSIDNTAELAMGLCKKHGFVFRRNAKNQGVSNTLNGMTLEFGEADYFFAIASDDVLVDGGLSKAVEVMQRSAQLGGVYARVEIIDAKGRELGEMRNSRSSGWIYKDVILGRIGIPHQWVLWKREVIKTVGLYDPSMPLDDQYYFNKAAKVFPIGYADAFWVKYRQHPTNSTKSTWRIYEASRRLTQSYESEEFYPELRRVAALNWWLLLAQQYPKEARLYFRDAARRWWDKRFVAGLLCFLRLGAVVELFRRR